MVGCCTFFFFQDFLTLHEWHYFPRLIFNLCTLNHIFFTFWIISKIIDNHLDLLKLHPCLCARNQGDIQRMLHGGEKIWIFCLSGKSNISQVSAANKWDIALPQEHKIHIFKQRCNVLFILWTIKIHHRDTCLQILHFYK